MIIVYNNERNEKVFYEGPISGLLFLSMSSRSDDRSEPQTCIQDP